MEEGERDVEQGKSRPIRDVGHDLKLPSGWRSLVY